MKNSIVKLINNSDGLYEGDLRYYFKKIFSAPNIKKPFHNFRYMLHVTVLVYEGAKHEKYYERVGERRFRALLIATLFQNYGHKGTTSNDGENIKIAITAAKHFILEEDKDLLPEIEDLISVTEYPHAKCYPTFAAQLMRDAEMSQNFSDVWLQQIIFGLSGEASIDPFECLKNNLGFISNLEFNTEWAKEKFSIQKEEKINELRDLLEILE